MSALARRILPEWILEYGRYRELFFFLVWRDVKIRYKQTLLGAAWAILQPFLTMVVFTVIFGRGAGVDSYGMPYPLFFYSAMVPWTFVQQGIPLSGNSLVANAKLISKVYFPRAIIPTAPALAGIVDFLIASTILVGMMFYYKQPIGFELAAYFVLVIPIMLFVMAVGMFFAALNVKFRDIKYTIPFFVNMMLFLSGVPVPPEAITGKFAVLLQLNPLVAIIRAFRASVDVNQVIDWPDVARATAIILVLLVLSAIYFRKTEREFADVI